MPECVCVCETVCTHVCLKDTQRNCVFVCVCCPADGGESSAAAQMR